MIVIPDLFGAYQKGREAAIEANWKDLQNYEGVENARHQNDAAALTNLATMADFGKQRRLTDNQVTNSDLVTELNVESHPGNVYNARTNTLIAGVNYGTINDNLDTVKGIAANNLTTIANNAQTGVNNSGTNLLNSSIAYGVTEQYYPELYNAAAASVKAGADIQTITAQYGPAVTKLALDLKLKEGLITYEQYNQEMTRLRAIAPYVGPTAAANAQAGLITAQGNVTQSRYNNKVIDYTNKAFALQNRLAQLTSAYKTEEATGGPNTKRATDLAKQIAEVQDELARLAGVTGPIAAHTPTSVPVIDPSTGVYLGSMDTYTGAVTRANPTSGTTTGNLFSASPPVRTPSQIAADNTGRTTVMTGTPLIAIRTPTTQQTTTATHYLPNGQRVVTSTPVRTSTALISPSQLNSNLQNRKGGVL